MPCASRAWITAQRRRSGLRSFPRRCPSTPASPGSAPRPDASASHSPAPVPSAAAPDPPSTHQTPCANGSTSARRSQLPCRLAVTSSRSQHSLQPVAADSRSAPPYASCLVPYSTPLVPVCSHLNWYKSGRAFQRHLEEERLSATVLRRVCTSTNF